ncbi:GerAB/ArcD/ProY family transporter [Paenactinomyces guangxiensis]|uniref:GerAB/ArcD/ProY family transporter n=1 Tax=Paenactinomyces guangxiensis TaxID=1490290 RepID=A0A7W1WQY3_9BACL|nr:GerAB/ArcD/ProY family transporter [Paenactinomyces guangxiensis]MBA4494294.1 GerAB/ArcD/ProY family transporter [Paenactinomyces guangxiensis]MBH8590788.1 GerAB/ArcD/ProY family transporter [Paenactinomyces guangxiensis]
MITRPKDRITTIQAAVAVTSFILGFGILTLPRGVTEKTGTPDGWISVLLGGVIAMVVGIMIAKLCRRFPGKTFYQFSREITGKWLGGLFNLIMVIYFTLVAGLEARGMSEVTKLFLLPQTAGEATILTFMFVGMYLITAGINPIVRLFQILLPITVIIFFVLLGISFQVFEINNLRPVMGLGISPVLKGLSVTALSYIGFEIMLVLNAFMKEPNKAVQAIVLGTLTPIFMYIIIVAIVVGSFGVDEVTTYTWPTVSLFRSFEVTGIIFERYETFLLALWIMELFATLVGAHYFAALGLAQLFKKQDQLFMYALLPMIYIIAMTPKNLNTVFKLGDWIGYLQLFLVIVIVPVLMIVAILRGKKHDPVS